MTLSYYDPKLLRFLYELTKLPRFMSFRDISKELKKNGFSASPKTIERWVNFLKKDYQIPGVKKSKDIESSQVFNYFPTFFYEELGLTTVFMVLHEPKDILFEGYPFSKYHDFASWLFDPKTFKEVFFYIFEVPTRYLKLFKREWKWIKERKVVKDYEMFITHKSFNVYAPLHKVIDKQGNFHFEENPEELVSKVLKNYEKHRTSLPSNEMSSLVKKNPLLIPIIFEQNRMGFSSIKIWDEMKKKMGNKKAWEFVTKSSRRKSDHVAIKRIQQAFKELYHSEILHQMRLIYAPLEHESNFYVYFYLEFDNFKGYENCLKKIIGSSIYLSFRPTETKNKNIGVFAMCLVNNHSLIHLFPYLSENKKGRIFFLEQKRSLPFLTKDKFCKFDYKHSFSAPARKWLL